METTKYKAWDHKVTTMRERERERERGRNGARRNWEVLHLYRRENKGVAVKRFGELVLGLR